MSDSTTGVRLLQSGEYDGVSASGNATTRLIAAASRPRSTPLRRCRRFDSLDLSNTVDGVNYGVPHGRGANVLAWNTETITDAPTSWDVIWEHGADYAGDISIYDSSIFIADAALHLMSAQPDLGIEDPYQLDPGAVRCRDRAA